MRSILLLEHSPDYSGGQAVFIQLISLIKSLPFERVGVAYPFGGNLEKKIKHIWSDCELTSIDMPDINLSNGRKNSLDYIKVMVYVLRLINCMSWLRRYNWWYVNGGRILVPISIIAFILRKCVIYHAHLSHSGIEKKIIVFLLRINLIRYIICPSQFVKSSLTARLPAKISSKIVVIENSLSKRFSELEFVNRFKCKNTYSIGLFGKVSEGKGQSVILEIARRFVDIKFFIIGNPLRGQEEYLDKLKFNAPKNIFFIGETDDIPSTINDLGIQICLVPSLIEESFGLIAIEAMACSCLTISSSKGALSEIAGKSGMLIYDTTDQLFSTLNWVMSLSIKELGRISHMQHSMTLSKYSTSFDFAMKNFIYKCLL